MEKFLVVNNGNYTIQVQPGGSITLDADGTGEIFVNGDLTVSGSTTTLTTTELTVTDKLIVLNKDEPSVTGIGSSGPGRVSGLEIYRGPTSGYPAARLVFNETISWNDVSTSSTKFGSFELVDLDGNHLPLKLSNIVGHADRDIVFDLQGTDSIVRVDIDDYSTRITQALSRSVDPDSILASVKYVQDTVAGELFLDDTRITIDDDSLNPGRVRIIVDDHDMVQVTYGPSPSVTFFEAPNQLNFTHNLIVNENNSTPLVITSNYNEVKLNSILDLQEQVSAPTNEVGYTKLYASAIGSGGTGLHFVNENNGTDELISKTKALVFSIIL